VAARTGLPLPVTPDELRAAQQWWTYRTKKAQKQLGFKARPHEETLEDTVRWQLERLGDRVDRASNLDLPLAVLGRTARFADRVLGR
jgi:hypothetical protein